MDVNASTNPDVNPQASKVPPAGGQAAATAEAVAGEWKAKAKGIGTTVLEGGAQHILKPTVYGFFTAAGALLAYKGGKRIGLI